MYLLSGDFVIDLLADHQETASIVQTGPKSTFSLAGWFIHYYYLLRYSCFFFPGSSKSNLLSQENDSTIISTIDDSLNVSPTSRSVTSGEARLHSKGFKRSFDEHEAGQNQVIGVTNDTGTFFRMQLWYILTFYRR